MGRKSSTSALNIWMNGELVGSWKNLSRGIQEFRYYNSWLNSENTRPISLSMPLAPNSVFYRGKIVENFFDNLLPDTLEIRKRIQSRFHSPSLQPFDLLKEIGKDCVGALQLLAEDLEPEDVFSINGEQLDQNGVATILSSVTATPFPGSNNNDVFRISVAGAQEKTALLFHKGNWHIPHGSTPTTHIFKLPLGKIMNTDMSSSIENEWFCSKIMQLYGIPTANCEIMKFNDQKALVVERFDRKYKNSDQLIRIPMEDMCQASGISPNQKYESDGGPKITDIMKILLGSENSLNDRRNFIKIQMLFWLLAAPDGHAKNYSIFLKKKGRFSLTPIYDVISAYPVMGKKAFQIAPEKLRMAMSVKGRNRHYQWNKIQKRHWILPSEQSKEIIEKIFAEIVEQTPKVIFQAASIVKDDFPSSVSDPIIEGLEKSVKKIT